MQNEAVLKVNDQSESLFAKVKKAFLQIFRLCGQPVVKVYHGYGSADKIVVFGHVFSLSPLPRKKYRKNFWTNAFAMLRSFMVVPVKGASVVLHWQGKICKATTARDGFFRMECAITSPMPPGLHKVKVNYVKTNKAKPNIVAEGTGWVVIPHQSQLAFISDIDDTFLVSHSSNLRKKLYVLLTKNAHSRRPFDGVVSHYQLLSKAHMMADGANPFFYVSSSEWNLYDFIKEFCRTNHLPEGVFLLSQLKRFGEILKTGGNRHSTKFMRIARIMEMFPHHRFVLFGDDSQMDPTIYTSIIDYFPGRVVCVYLRHVYEKNSGNVKDLVKKMEAAGVPVCHFEHSREAIQHSYKIGLLRSEK